MAAIHSGKEDAQTSQNPGKREPTSIAIAKDGVKTANQFSKLMAALITDLLEGTVPSDVGNATCRAGANLLKVVEMQHRYNGVSPARELILHS